MLAKASTGQRRRALRLAAMASGRLMPIPSASAAALKRTCWLRYSGSTRHAAATCSFMRGPVDEPAHALRLTPRRIHQLPDACIGMIEEQLARRPVGDDAAFAHHDDAIREQHGLQYVVRHHEGRET